MKILLITLNPLGKVMSGPSVRYHEMAKELSAQHEVILATPNLPDFLPEGYSFRSHREMRSLIKWADVVISLVLPLKWALWMVLYRPLYILDAYDPMPLENLEKFKEKPLSFRRKKYHKDVGILRYAFKGADAVLYACPSQKDLWIGFWMSVGGIDPERYHRDPTLTHHMAYTPFGLSDMPPVPDKKIRKKFGIQDTDTLLIWGGGIWNWFDPLTLIQAVSELNQEGHFVKLLYMGSNPPGESTSETLKEKQAKKLSKELGVLNRSVFFNPEWVPYDERGKYLAAADIGVSCHYDHLETRYSFRTRVLDYLWASLPLILTEGDYFGEIVENEGAGVKVKYQDVQGVKAAILKIRENDTSFKENSKRLAERFLWSECLKPLRVLLDRIKLEKPRGFSFLKAVGLKIRLCLRDLL